MISMVRFLFILFVLVLSSPVFALKREMVLHHWDKTNGYPGGGIHAMVMDGAGFIWIASDEHLMRFDGKEFVKFDIPEIEGESFAVKSLVAGKQATLIALNAHQQGIRFDLQRLEFSTTYENAEGVESIDKKEYAEVFSSPASEKYRNITLGPNNTIWYSSFSEGIEFYEKKSQRVWSLKNIIDHPTFDNGYDILNDLSDYYITTLYFDQKDNLWIGTRNNGFFRITFKSSVFQFYKFDYNEKEGLTHRNISYPLVTQRGDVWISTFGGGVNIWRLGDLEKGKARFVSFDDSAQKDNPLSDGKIFPIHEDNNENIWFGAAGEGLFYIARQERQNQSFLAVKIDIGLDGEISTLYEDKHGRIWVGTSNGLARFTPEDNTWDHAFNELSDPDVFEENSFSVITSTGDSVVWLSTWEHGFYRWDLQKNDIKNYGTGPDTLRNHVLYCSTSINKDVWFGTSNGLLYYNSDKDLFTKVDLGGEYENITIEAIQCDASEVLWLGTSIGLLSYDTKRKEMEKHKLQGGVMSNSFTRGTSKDRAGYLYFGTRNGFCRFFPEEVQSKDHANQVMLVGCEVDGYRILDEESKLYYSANLGTNQYSQMSFDHTLKTIGFQYRCLNYDVSQPVEYEFRLLGNNSGWSTTLDDRKTWTKLSPGDYVFEVRQKGTSDAIAYPFVILTPWWQQLWGILVIIGCILLGIIGVSFFVIRRLKRRHELYQSKRFEDVRYRFFMNISHEIRSPLTLIKGGVDRVVNEVNDNESVQKELRRVLHNTDRLSRMVNNILDLKKMESTEIEVVEENFCFNDFLTSIVDAFSLREFKDVFVVELPDESIWINTDRELVETILYNLLTNAVKYSSPDDKITLTLDVSDTEYVVVRIKDQGVGIPQDEVNRIFERFEKGKNQPYSGAGIGLALSKEYAMLLGGDITVASKEGVGSVFSLLLPKTAVQNKEYRQESNVDESTSANKPLLIIVDDQKDIRSFVKETFIQQYRILTASDGQQAMALIKLHQPDLIISDIIMPVMDGLELCNSVRNSFDTCHIPVVLLTARADEEMMLKAISSQADTYITKPFSEDILRSKVGQLLQQRRMLQQRFSQEPDEKVNSLIENSMDSEFINKVETAIKEHIGDMDFRVEKLALMVAMSSSTLYKKLKALTGLTPVEYIRLHRLKEAARLLKQTSSSVGEITEQCGFGSSKTFSRVFKEQFGISPLQYRKKE
ncbi:hybrid sensor histidine kinase/response regulator [Puteibacter caeruleilacunae]|nr:hybrid sensor histidine kinase/response regulator [Puteibacter caeruleilacunae]